MKAAAPTRIMGRFQGQGIAPRTKYTPAMTATNAQNEEALCVAHAAKGKPSPKMMHSAT